MEASSLQQSQLKSLCGKLYSLLAHCRASKEDVETPMEVSKSDEKQQQQQQQQQQQLAYPNCDLNIWLRTCEEEIIKPLKGKVKGIIPTWINGCLYRNGPGKMTYGQNDVSHLFDSAGLLHGYSFVCFFFFFYFFLLFVELFSSLVGIANSTNKFVLLALGRTTSY